MLKCRFFETIFIMFSQCRHFFVFIVAFWKLFLISLPKIIFFVKIKRKRKRFIVNIIKKKNQIILTNKDKNFIISAC